MISSLYFFSTQNKLVTLHSKFYQFMFHSKSIFSFYGFSSVVELYESIISAWSFTWKLLCYQLFSNLAYKSSAGKSQTTVIIVSSYSMSKRDSVMHKIFTGDWDKHTALYTHTYTNTHSLGMFILR